MVVTSICGHGSSVGVYLCEQEKSSNLSSDQPERFKNTDGKFSARRNLFFIESNLADTV